VLGFEALAVLPLSALPAVAPADVESSGSAVGPWEYAPDWGQAALWRQDEEIIILRRKTSNRVGV